MNGFWQKLKTTLAMIKFEHTLFALPFAFLGAVLAADGLPSLWQIVWITAAMFGARSAAMSFNRLVDRRFDAENPRTANRELPSGKLSVKFAWAFFAASVTLFLCAAYSLNWLTFALAPIALISILGYSYAKRFTAWAHLILAGLWRFADCRLDCRARRVRFGGAASSFLARDDVDRRIRRDVCVSGLRFDRTSRTAFDSGEVRH
jgi:putative 4-hydroxybenzoate polyprenyltransferase